MILPKMTPPPILQIFDRWLD